MRSWKMCLVSKWAIFQFHDYRRKGNLKICSQAFEALSLADISVDRWNEWNGRCRFHAEVEHLYHLEKHFFLLSLCLLRTNCHVLPGARASDMGFCWRPGLKFSVDSSKEWTKSTRAQLLPRKPSCLYICAHSIWLSFANHRFSEKNNLRL